MKSRTAALLATALATALCLNSAHAASTASASVSIVGIDLIDLDPNDGIAPSIVLAPADDYRSHTNVSYLTYGGVADSDGKSSSEYFEALSAQYGFGTVASGAATKTGTSLSNLAASSSASGSAGDVYELLASASGRVNFFLSPNTSLSVTADITVAADSVPGQSTSALASAGVMINHPEATRPFGPYLSSLYQERDDGNYGQAGTFRLSDSISSGANGLDLYMYTWATSQVHLAPVPEPSTYGMLLAGLALVGAAARRARKRA